MRRSVLAGLTAGVLSVALLAGGAASAATRPAAKVPAARAAAAAPSATTPNHYISNLHGAVTGPRSVGFNIFDTGSSKQQIDALPSGVRALVWLGEKCPTAADDAFRSTVNALANDPKVFGYYLSDEPHIGDCPNGPQNLRTRTDFIRQTTGMRQKSFIVLSKQEDYAPFRVAVTGISYIGLDPYPCSVAHPTCDPSKIDEKVGLALQAGIPQTRLVPVYQAFGQTATSSAYYNLPTADQMQTMLQRWTTLVPHPAFDYTYGWDHQSSSNPTLVDSPSLQALFQGYFG
ncbi:MAG TPA: hypothetical protein VFX52_03665 [Nocardioidaceae bacterium]|nr:hypothetical protein [Nocardioidaceae bacterium]